MRLPPARRTVPAMTPAPPLLPLWPTLEAAWGEAAPELLEARLAPNEENVDALSEGAELMLEALRCILATATEPELLAFDRELEKALYDLDRAQIQEATDGSDDGFLYARGFIVAMGEAYFRAVDADPSRAILDAELEELCYLPWHLYADKFGEAPASTISRETRSNHAGWGTQAEPG